MKIVPVLLAALLLSGCTAVGAAPSSPAPSAPAPSAPETNPAPPSWTPDVIVERTFDTVPCEIRMRVVSVSATPDDETAVLLAGAKAFLAAGDWSATEVSLDDYPDEQLAAGREQGRSDSSLLIGLVADRISEDLRAAGLTGTGLSTEGFVSCEPE